MIIALSLLIISHTLIGVIRQVNIIDIDIINQKVSNGPEKKLYQIAGEKNVNNYL